ncbi:hypothetical protein FLONG3_1464 [Fusarium longipes]|uniref:Uncharacterized protein n=1 Tax=Fusarium longipes TaxID=694270 RepID=A0A395T7Y1_9HYPO|nr:hypothetical protein FLONG3_1464 [Fusarium longipes]
MPGLIRRLITPQRSQPKIRGQQNQNRSADLSDSCEDWTSCCGKKSSQTKTNSTKSRLPVPKKSSVIATPVTIQRVPEVHRIPNAIPARPTPRLRAPSVSSSRFEGRNAALEALTGNDATNRPAHVLCPVEHGQTHPHSYHHSHSSQSSRYLRPPRSRNGHSSPINDNSSYHERISPEASILSLSDHGIDGYEVEPTSWQPDQPVYDGQSLGSSSDSVDRLFRETDEAFKALGSALRETQRASQMSVLPLPPSPPGIPTNHHKHSKSMPLPAGFQKHSRWRGEETSSVSSHRSSPDRRISVVKKPQRKKQSFVGQSFSKAAIRTPRWTLSENMTDFLTGQRFRRIEADEMLTPARIEALRRKREAAQQLDDERAEERARERYSIDSIRSAASDNSETDVEPFHLEQLASRIGVRQVVEKTAVPVEATPPSPELTPDLGLISQDITKHGSMMGDNESIGSTHDKSEASPKIPPQIPDKNLARLDAEPVEVLPSIAEVVGTAAAESQPELSSGTPATEPPRLIIEETDEYYYLKSTSYTLTKPSFRHGPIALAKIEVNKGLKAMDDTLDWTAFQMAILGGAGDFFQDMSIDEDTKQAEDIASWFDAFGFETYGTLIPGDMPKPGPEVGPTHVHTHAPPSLRSSSHSTFSSTPSTIDTDIDLPIPVGAEFPSGFWNAPAPGQALDKAKFFNSTGLKRWVGEGRPKRPTSHSEEEESLPPSPMMPLVVHMSAGEADIPDTVPMGYNLHHDLGDFLKWEAENVYDSSFSKSP